MSFMYDASMSDSFRMIFGFPGLSERRTNYKEKAYLLLTCSNKINKKAADKSYVVDVSLLYTFKCKVVCMLNSHNLSPYISVKKLGESCRLSY